MFVYLKMSTFVFRVIDTNVWGRKLIPSERSSDLGGKGTLNRTIVLCLFILDKEMI